MHTHFRLVYDSVQTLLTAMQRPHLFLVLLNQHISRFLLRPNDFTIADELSSPLTIIFYVQILKGNHLSWVNWTDCLTEYSRALVSCTAAQCMSGSGRLRIVLSFPLKCYDVRTEINAGTAGTWMRQQKVLNFVSEMFCACTFCHFW